MILPERIFTTYLYLCPFLLLFCFLHFVSEIHKQPTPQFNLFSSSQFHFLVLMP